MPHPPPFSRAVLLACLLAAAAVVSASTPGPAALPPQVDLLEAPAPATRLGEHKLLLDVAQAGSRLVAVGEFGLALVSDDQGRHWTQAPTPTSVMLTAVSFANARQGWAVGHDGVILATSDGGRSWTRQFDGRRGDTLMLDATRAQLARLPASRAGTAEQPSPQRMMLEDAIAGDEAAVDAGPSRPLLAVRFANAQTGFAAGAFGQLFATSDGGEHWSYIGDRLDNLEGLHLNAITLTPDGHVYVAAEAGTVFTSADLGQTWTRSNLGYKGHLYGVLPLPGGSLMAYGFNGHLFRSTDGGQSWRSVLSPTGKSIVAGSVILGVPTLIDEDGQLLHAIGQGGDQGSEWALVGQRLTVRRVASMAALPSSETAGFQPPAMDVLTVGLGGAARHVLPIDTPATHPTP